LYSFRGSVLSFIQMETFIKGYNGKFNYKMDKNNLGLSTL
jgi:hypothetical protein